MRAGAPDGAGRPEFSRPILCDRLAEGGETLCLAAEPEERAALAERFGLLGLDRLEARLELVRTARGIACRGMVSAEAVQQCVVSGEPVAARVEAPVDLRFEPEDPAPADEVMLEADALDLLPLGDGRVDLGEAVAQTLLLALDPYPRADAQTLSEARRHLLSEEEAAARAAAGRPTPFAVLRRS